jgi:co-chaperonin GroES (HSP10)
MKVLHDNVLVTQDTQKEKTTESGLILTTDVTTGHKPAIVIAVGDDVPLVPKAKVFLDWSKSLPVEIDGLKCAVIKYEDIKLIMD